MLQPSRFRTAVSGVLACAFFHASLIPVAFANLPTGGQVVHGNVAITQAGSAMNLQQASRNAIVNWQSFNIGAGNSVRIEQASAEAAMLARVVGGDASQLLGSLKADGKLFLINPNGIVVGQGAVIDTAGFLGSTLDVTDAEFLAGGAMTFKGESDTAIVNLGIIMAREGSVMLFAHSVKNIGEITAPKGTAGLGAGTEVLLASPNADGFVIKTNLPTTSEKTAVDNSGVIAAAQAQLEAAGGSIYELAVNQSGVVRVTGSEVRNGRVLLTAQGGTVGVSGEISAQNANGSGGEILVGGDFRGHNADVANAARTVVTPTAKLDASAANETSAAGRVIVWADGATRFLGSLKATGAGGGFAEVSGKRWLDFNPASIVQLGRGGTLLLDPDALIISEESNSGATTTGGDPFTFNVSWEIDEDNPWDFEAPPPSILNVVTLQDQLAVSNVVLDTSTALGDVSFEAPVTWNNDNTLTVRSGNGININADITGGANSTLELYTGLLATGIGELGFHDIDGDASLAEEATIKVGTLVYGANEFAEYPASIYTPMGDTPSTGGFWIEGNIDVNTLRVDLSAGDAGVATWGTNNTIRNFHATGSHSLSAYVENHNGDLDATFDDTRSDALYLDLLTSGNLTLTSGSSLTFNERDGDPDYVGTVVLGSIDGGAFINDAGANVFGGAARFLIYSSTTSATDKGGLVGSVADTFNHPYDPNEFFDDANSRFFFTALSGAPILTYKADDLSRYYGSANPAFTFTRSGLIDGVIDDVTGAPSLSATASQNSGVGAYAINIGLGNLVSSNYDFDFVPGTLTIERAPLTVTANNKTRRIGLENPSFDASFSGFVLDQNEAVLGGALAFATAATSGSAAGNYTIAPSGLTSANYEITFMPGTLTLTETTALLISANNASRNYGAGNPAFTASYSGFVGGETDSIVTGLQFSTSATQASGIGEYNITPFGATAPGYDISYEAGVLTIERAPLTISVPNQSRFYGDANDLTVNFNGLVNDETSAVVTGLSVSSAAMKTSNVGTYAINASGATADNYAITYSVGSLTVTAAPLTVNIDAATRRYGDADPVFTYSIGGLKNGDSESLVTVDNLASLASANAGIGDYGIVGFPFVSSLNYTVAAQVFGTLTITPRSLSITANDVSRVYGEANPTFTATFDGLASFDTPGLFGDLGLTTQAAESSGVGEWGITFSNAIHQNYAITSEFGTLTITPAPLTILPLVELSRVYGRANPAMPLPEVGGLKLNDTVAGLGLAFETPALTADVGTYTYRLTTTNPNYSLTSATGEFRIDPATLRVAIAPAARVYGDANPSRYEVVANGLAFDDSAADVVGVFNPTDSFTGIGIYAVEPRLLSPNYVIESFTGGAFQINPRPLIFTAADRTRVYGDINPFFFGSITGFANGDGELNVVSNYGFVTTAERTSNVGTYAIRPTAQVTANYVPVFQDGVLTVTPAAATVVIGNAARSYGRVNPVFEIADVNGVKNDGTVLSLALNVTADAGVASDVGTYAINGVSGTPNYTVTFVPGTLTIERASASIAGSTASRPFGDVITAPLSITFTGFLAADEAQARSNWQMLFADYPTLAPGANVIDFTQALPAVATALAKNYDIAFTPGTVNVTPRPFVIAAPDYSMNLGDAFTNPFALPTPTPLEGAPEFTVIGRSDWSGKSAGNFKIVPEIVPAIGGSRADLDRYYAFDLTPGTHAVSLPKDVVDLTNNQLDPSLFNRLNNDNNTIYRDNTPSDQKTVELEKNDKITVAVPRDVSLQTNPLTKAEYANYFGSFAGEEEAIRSALVGSYQTFLEGKGKPNSGYEYMSAEGRALLEGWQSGAISTKVLQAQLAAGDPAASEAFGFIFPTLIERTRDKDVADMTPADRAILGRLADLTEERRATVHRIAQEKLAAANAARDATSTGMMDLMRGPGDFPNIVNSAMEEALAIKLGVGVGAGVALGAATPAILMTPAVFNALFPLSFASSASATISSVAVPAIVVTSVITLVTRAVQIGESLQNEKAYNDLMALYRPGTEITSIAELKSDGMNNDMKLSTLLLAAEMLNTSR